MDKTFLKTPSGLYEAKLMLLSPKERLVVLEELKSKMDKNDELKRFLRIDEGVSEAEAMVRAVKSRLAAAP